MKPRYQRSALRAMPAALLLTFLIHEGTAHAEEPEKLPVVVFNADLNAFEHVLPHRKAFAIEITRSGIDAEYDGITSWFAETDKDACPSDSSRKPLIAAAGELGADGKRKYRIQVPGLKYSTGYCFWFQLDRQWSTADAKAVDEAFDKVFAAEGPKGSIAQEESKNVLDESLGRRGKLFVRTQSDDTPRTLANVLYDEFWKLPATQATLAVQAWDNYHSARFNAMTHAAIAIHTDVPAASGKAFKPSLPDDVRKLDSAWNDFVAAAKAAGYDKELSNDEQKQSRGKTPAARTALESTLKTKAEEAEKTAGAVNGSQCTTALTKGKPDLVAYCNVVTTLTAELHEVADCLGDTKLVRFAQSFQDTRTKMRHAVEKLVEQFKTDSKPLANTAQLTYTERSGFYVSADLGGVVPIFKGSGVGIAPFFGVNIYLTQVDKDVPLAEEGGFLKRFSFTAGMTLSSVSDSSGSTTGAVNGNGVMFGAGIRATDYLRVGLGTMLVSQKDANPVVNDRHLRVVPYLSTSLDIDVAGTIRAQYNKSK